MQPFLVAADADWGIEKFAELWRGEEFFAGTIADDATVAHQDHPFNLGQDVAQMMSDQDEAGAFRGQATQGVAQFALRGQVKGVGGLIEQQLAGPVNEGASDEDAALFAGGHFSDKLSGKVRGFDALEGFGGSERASPA